MVSAVFGSIFMTALIALFIVALFAYCKKREAPKAHYEKACRKGIRSLNEAQLIIEEGYLCRWNPKEDPKYSKWFSQSINEDLINPHYRENT